MTTTDSKANQLKLVSAEFRRLCSEALRAESGYEAHYCIGRINEFVSETPLLASAAASAPWSGEDALDALREAREDDERIRMPVGRRQELGFLHKLLVGMANLPEEEFSKLTVAYGGKTKHREWVGMLMRDTVGRYAECLSLVITQALLEASPYGARSVKIRGVRGRSQVIVNMGNGTVHAEQTIRKELSAIREAVDVLTEALDSEVSDHLDAEVREDLRDTAAAVREEIERPKPRRVLLKSAKERLMELAALTTVGDFIAKQNTTVAELIDTVLRHMST